MIAVLYPRFDHPAIEERYASWQTQMLLKREADIEFAFYDPEEPASIASGAIEAEHALVITDPLLIPPARLGWRLREMLVHAPEAIAAVPVSNVSSHPRQLRSPMRPYVTLRELQEVMTAMQGRGIDPERVQWDESDPAAYLVRSSFLDSVDDLPRRVLEGREVVVSGTDYVHRWASLRGQHREDLLSRISTSATSMLEFGCGEAPLGAALKARQKCRVVGIEIDPKAAAIAQKRIDDVYCGDAREIVALIHETFDFIVGGDIVEHLDEPWSFLADMRRVAATGGHLLLSIPNLANAAIVADLLRGRFDYVYMGMTCVGHLRFFTRQTIEEMLTIAGWTVVSIEPQDVVATSGREELLRALSSTNLEFSRDDVLPSGFYVTARNDR